MHFHSVQWHQYHSMFSDRLLLAHGDYSDGVVLTFKSENKKRKSTCECIKSFPQRYFTRIFITAKYPVFSFSYNTEKILCIILEPRLLKNTFPYNKALFYTF